jgi:YebC/PmpR family DNA-binding regulatory protein
MSGHSKWSTIKRAKGVTDVKRGVLFTKLAKTIAVAARDGADPTFNAKLRLAIDRAKVARMPKDNIDRAVARGSGTAEAAALEEVLYEGFAAGGAAVLVHALTDNRNRTVNEIRSIFQRNGGTLGSANSVAWQFTPTGTLVFPLKLGDREKLELSAIEAGAEDVVEEDERVIVRTKPEQLGSVRTALTAAGFSPESSDVERIAQQSMTVSTENRGKVLALLSELDDHPDVLEVNTNAELPDA